MVRRSSIFCRAGLSSSDGDSNDPDFQVDDASVAASESELVDVGNIAGHENPLVEAILGALPPLAATQAAAAAPVPVAAAALPAPAGDAALANVSVQPVQQQVPLPLPSPPSEPRCRGSCWWTASAW